ncbi:histone-arginine methyltransferase CARM1 [Cryptococcus neoformans]|nr:histone-arginine methyltransferase CARM1 [Cryptococcus neoformans var. grubii]
MQRWRLLERRCSTSVLVLGSCRICLLKRALIKSLLWKLPQWLKRLKL